MKTAISLPDPLFLAAEKAARRLSMSRSRLYAKAIAEFVELHAQADVTERLDRVYESQPSSLDSALKKMQRLSVEGDAW
jgi:metal-responsive CopG/Arc/MetJ family transcriptional regulator